MKTTIKQVVECFKALGNAKVNKLDEAEKIKILKARKVMRPIAEAYEEFLKDAQEMFKPENWDEIQKKTAQWKEEGEKTSLSEAERAEVNKALSAYFKSVNATVKDELTKEVEIEVEKLKENSDIKIMEENDWKIGDLDLIEILL